MNIKFRFTAFLLFLLIGKNVFSQNCGENLSGTKTLYTPQQKKLTPPPAGFEPVFVNHLGRHGARHLTKAVNASFTWQILLRADSANALTSAGKKLKEMVTKLQLVEQPNLKNISVTGKTEQEDLGARMIQNYKSAFAQSGNIKISTTKEVRTEQSAQAFLAGAKLNENAHPFQFDHGNTNELRFYDVAPAYLDFEKNGDWQKQMLLLAQQNQLEKFNEQITEKFFTADFLKSLKQKQTDKLVDDIFGFAEIVPSIGTEIKAAGFTNADLNFYSLFTCDELKKLNLMDTASDYLLKGPGTDPSGIQVKIAVPLLVDFIKSTQNYIDKRSIVTNLRFAHAETVGPFATLLGLDGAAKSAPQITGFQQVYQAEKIIPLSANIDWILYRKNSTGDYLIKFLLNEKEVHIDGLQTANFPYYRWKDVQQFYLQKLKKFGASLTDDMKNYLANLK